MEEELYVDTTNKTIHSTDNLSQLTDPVLYQQFEDSLLDSMLGENVNFLFAKIQYSQLYIY